MPDHLVTRADLDATIRPIATEVHEIQTEMKLHLRHSDVQDARLEEVVAILPRIRELEDWRLETLTMIRLLKLTFGASIIAAVVGILNLVDLVRHSGGF